MCEHGQWVYDPRGFVEARVQPLAARVDALDDRRIAVLDNGKWNAGGLLRRVVAQLGSGFSLGPVRHYRKASFSRNADAALLCEIAEDNDLALIAIGD